MRSITALLQDDSGQTMAEYGLVAGALGAAMIAAVATLDAASGQMLAANANGLVAVALNPP